jgi:hypothetical protein
VDPEFSITDIIRKGRLGDRDTSGKEGYVVMEAEIGPM